MAGLEASDGGAGWVADRALATGPFPATSFKTGRGRQNGGTSTKVGHIEAVAWGWEQKLRHIGGTGVCSDQGGSASYAQLQELQEQLPVPPSMELGPLLNSLMWEALWEPQKPWALGGVEWHQCPVRPIEVYFNYR